MSNSTHEHGIVQPILDAISSWVKEYRQAVGLRGELANFREEEIAFIASDMGLTAEELLFAVSKGLTPRTNCQNFSVHLVSIRRSLPPQTPPK